MSEEQIQDVQEAEEAVQPQESENIQPPEDAQDASREEPKEGSKEFNFARLREQNERLERQNQELTLAFKGIQESLKLKPVSPPEEHDELDSLADDDIITASQARKMAERMAKKTIEESLVRQERASLPERTRQQHSDFDQVLTDENIKEFEKQNPVLAVACTRADNPWQAAYEAIKMTPAYQNREVKKQMSKDSRKIDENIAKPVSSNALGASGALSNASAYGEMSREDLYKEMMSAASQG